MTQTIQSLKKFHFSIGGYGGTNHELIVDANSLTYKTWEYVPAQSGLTRELQKAELGILIKALNASEFLSWNSKYFNPGVLDGTQWEVSIQYNGSLRKKVYGSNAYPLPKPGADSMDPSAAFLHLIKALKKLESNISCY